MYNTRERQTGRNTGFFFNSKEILNLHRSLTGPGGERKQHGDKSNEMTLQECKLAFFGVVAAPAQAHETSLAHTQTSAKTQC